MSFQLVRPTTTKPTRILVLNPNSSQSMTDGLKPIIESVELSPTTEVYTYTAPEPSPASINNAEDIEASYEVVRDHIHGGGGLDKYDGILVACFSVHPLVGLLQLDSGLNVAVTGIFEASILTAISLTGGRGRWGVVTTGKFWEEHLSAGVAKYLGATSMKPADGDGPFAGVESTGLNASDFHHGVNPSVVTQKIREATMRLLDKHVTCIIMGCAGMAGLEETIRSAAWDKTGNKEWAYEKLHVIDGVRAGLVQVDQMIKNHRLRRRPE